jgi:tripartite motif-containing protein 71
MKHGIAWLVGFAVLVLGGGLTLSPALASNCGKDCKTLIKTEFKACKTACPKGSAGKACKKDCSTEKKVDGTACKNAANPTPPNCGGTDDTDGIGGDPTTTTTTTVVTTTTTTTTLACGIFVTKWGSFGSGDGQFNTPEGVAVDGSGNVFVADYGNDRIQKFTNTGTFVTKWGSTGSGDGQFNSDIGVGVDGSGNVFVADTYNNRIQKFDNSGTLLSMFGWGVQDGSAAFETCTSSCQGGISGTGDGQFSTPTGVAFDGTANVYVADLGNNRIQKFDNSGTLLSMFGWGVQDGSAAFETCTSSCQAGISGSGDGQFNAPHAVAVDGSGNVFVTDEQNHRIQKFDGTGTFLTKWGSLGSGDGQFTNPFNLAVDGSGHVFVGDGNNRIQKFTNTGTFVTKWGSSGTGDGQFSTPTGVAVDGTGNIFVGDFNNRIQKFMCP